MWMTTSPRWSSGRRGSANVRRGTPVSSIAVWSGSDGAAPIVNVTSSRRESRTITNAVATSPIASAAASSRHGHAGREGRAVQPKNTSTVFMASSDSTAVTSRMPPDATSPALPIRA